MPLPGLRSSFRRRPEALFNSRRAGHPVTTRPEQAVSLLDSSSRWNDG
jgi:hypothetical protein